MDRNWHTRLTNHTGGGNSQLGYNWQQPRFGSVCRIGRCDLIVSRIISTLPAALTKLTRISWNQLRPVFLSCKNDQSAWSDSINSTEWVEIGSGAVNEASAKISQGSKLTLSMLTLTKRPRYISMGSKQLIRLEKEREGEREKETETDQAYIVHSYIKLFNNLKLSRSDNIISVLYGLHLEIWIMIPEETAINGHGILIYRCSNRSNSDLFQVTWYLEHDGELNSSHKPGRGQATSDILVFQWFHEITCCRDHLGEKYPWADQIRI